MWHDCLRARRPYVGVQLSLRHRRDRVNWVVAHRRWTRRQWNEVVFSDESRFNLSCADGRLRVCRRRGERFDLQNVIEWDRYGGGSVMIWGGTCHGAKTDIVTVAGNLTSVRYCAEIIEHVVVPFIRQRHASIFQQDNARPHSARHTQEILRQNYTDVLQWPAKSPDLSPIEHMWDYLGRKVRARIDVDNVRDHERALHQEWQRISMQVVRKLINSMRRRCGAVVAARGLHTRYLHECDFWILTPVLLTGWYHLNIPSDVYVWCEHSIKCDQFVDVINSWYSQINIKWNI